MLWWHWALIALAVILLVYVLVKTGADPTAMFDAWSDSGGSDWPDSGGSDD